MEIGDWSRKIGDWSLGARRFFGSRRGVADRRRGFREELLDETCSCLSIARFATGPKRSMGHLLGGEKNNFFNSRYYCPTMTAASMESCRFVTRRSPGGRFRSVVDVGKRLHRTRGGFHRCIHISKVLCALLLWTMICQRFRSRALWGAPSTGARGVGDHPTPGISERESASRPRVCSRAATLKYLVSANE